MFEGKPINYNRAEYLALGRSGIAKAKKTVVKAIKRYPMSKAPNPMSVYTKPKAKPQLF